MSDRVFRDNDVLVSVYTRENGRLELLARGAKKITSKLKPHIEPISLTRLMIASGRTVHLAGAQSLSAFPRLKESYEKRALALMLLEVANVLIGAAEPDERIYYLFEVWLNFLENNNLPPDSAAQQLLAWLAGWQLLVYLGYGPEVFECVRCHSEIIPHHHYFSVSAGGLVCNRCFIQSIDQPISLAAVKIVRLFFSQPQLAAAFAILGKLKAPSQVINELNGLAKDFTEYIMNRQTQAWKLYS